MANHESPFPTELPVSDLVLSEHTIDDFIRAYNERGTVEIKTYGPFAIQLAEHDLDESDRRNTLRPEPGTETATYQAATTVQWLTLSVDAVRLKEPGRFEVDGHTSHSADGNYGGTNYWSNYYRISNSRMVRRYIRPHTELCWAAVEAPKR